MKRIGMRLTVLALGALAISTSLTGNTARAWVPGINGNILYTSSEGHGAAGGVWLGSPHIWVIRPDGANKHQLTSYNDAWPSWSPDGQKIVFSRQWDANTALDWRIFEMNADGSGQHPLTPATPGTDPNRGDNMPRFSPDGTKIVYIKTIPDSDPTRPPNAQIWLMNADGSSQHQLTDFAPTHIYAAGWSYDGSKILFSANSLDGGCSGVATWLGCRTFYEMSPVGGAPVALAIQAGQPNPASGGYGAWGSFDESPGLFAYGDATSVATPTGLLRDDMPDHYKIFEATVDGASWTQTGLVGDHPTLAPDAGVTGDIAFVGCVGGADRILGHCNYQLSVSSLFAETPQQLTFDAGNHYSPSWGPTSPKLVLRPNALSLELAPQLGTPTIPVLVHCGSTTGHPCSFKLRLTMGTSGQGSSSMTFTGQAGTSRLVRLPLPKSAKAGTSITIQLTTTINGQSSRSQVTSRVLQRASLGAVCPTPTAQAGSKVTLSGKLSDGAPTGKAVVIVATAPDGQAFVIPRTTTTGGSYSATFFPGFDGLWELQAVWTGDATHPFTTSRSCAVMVPTPPPTATQLGISCPSFSALNSPLPISGGLSPAFGGAQIAIEYSHVRQNQTTEKFTDTVATDSKGAFADAKGIPDDPGEWDVTAFYDGDAANQGSTSQTCAITVE